MQDVPLRPGDYFHQLAGALSGLDFALLALKTLAVRLHHRPGDLLSRPGPAVAPGRGVGATVAAVAQSIIACVLIDALFIIIYLDA